MANKINIAIPEPCHENWEAMTAVEKGRFCGSCQKNVFDFTSSSDREIINAFEKDNNLCGRFLNTQLNRDIVKPKEKSTIWLATTTALINFVGLGTHEVQAQGNVVVQTDKKVLSDPKTIAENQNILVSGIVYDENKTPMPNLGIYIKQNRIGKTDHNGNFSVTVPLKTRLAFMNEGDDSEMSIDYYVKNRSGNNNIEVNQTLLWSVKESHSLGGAIAVGINIKQKNRTFFGRIFHSIGNLFR